MQRITLADRLRYWFDNTISKGTVALIGWLVALTMTLVFASTLLVYFSGIANGGEHELGFFETPTQVIASGWSALVFSLLGLIGAALWIAKPHLGELIMAAAGVAIVFSISMFAVIARPLFLVAALLGRVRQEAQRPPRTQRSTEWRILSL